LDELLNETSLAVQG